MTKFFGTEMYGGVSMRKSFKDSLKVLEADSQDANTLVSKGVRDIPGNLQSATSNVPTGKSFMTFGILLGVGVFLVFIAFTVFVPVMVLVPQKFAICFTIGCALIIASFFALKGYRTQFLHMTSKETLSPFLSEVTDLEFQIKLLHSEIPIIISDSTPPSLLGSHRWKDMINHLKTLWGSLLRILNPALLGDDRKVRNLSRSEFRLSQIYQEGLLKLQAKEYEKARELLENVLKDIILPNGHVTIASKNLTSLPT